MWVYHFTGLFIIGSLILKSFIFQRFERVCSLPRRVRNSSLCLPIPSILHVCSLC